MKAFCFTDDLNNSGPLTYIFSLTVKDKKDEIVEEYSEHDMPRSFLFL